ncbi:hypothetical protein BC628DRAFT_1420456 [Trametes gibbosa]|nr:hypothetical protein BC628DRAFT_1420456 [Trametes gibbosa]
MSAIAEAQALAEDEHSILDGGANTDDDALSEADSEDLDQMAQTLAELSESEDELLSSLDSNPAALEACLVAEGNSKEMDVVGKNFSNREKNLTNAQSKTQARTQLERPVFKTPAIPATPGGSSGDLVSAAELAASQSLVINLTGPDLQSDDNNTLPSMDAADYKIIYSSRGGPLSLKAQHIDIQDVIRAASRRLERDLVTMNAFPDARNRGRSVRLALVDTAKKMQPSEKYAQLTVRMVTDSTFTRTIASIPNQRISTFRGRVKEKSDIAVANAYGLVPGKAQEQVAWLLPELIYIYPTDYQKRYIAEGKPYQHSVVTSILREVFFKGATSFSVKNDDVFVSSLPERPEKEIPMVMLALVGAAIHASLMDWASGHFVSVSSFSADRYYDAYNEHITFLTGIKKNSISKYHTMMYKLYNNIISGAAHANGLDGTVTASSALTRLNLSAMDED